MSEEQYIPVSYTHLHIDDTSEYGVPIEDNLASHATL